jgi:hypothetical protein
MIDPATQELLDAAKLALKTIALLTPFAGSEDSELNEALNAVADVADTARAKLRKAITLFEQKHGRTGRT